MKWRLFNFINILCIWVFCLPVYLCTLCLRRSEEDVRVISYHEGAGNRTLAEQQVLFEPPPNILGTL